MPVIDTNIAAKPLSGKVITRAEMMPAHRNMPLIMKTKKLFLANSDRA